MNASPLGCPCAKVENESQMLFCISLQTFVRTRDGLESANPIIHFTYLSIIDHMDALVDYVVSEIFQKM